MTQQPQDTRPHIPAEPRPNWQPPQARRGPGWLAVIVALIVGLVVGGVVILTGKQQASNATPVTVVTKTVTTQPAAPTQSVDTSPDITYTPHKADWVVGVKILSKECFGSAGCNIAFRIKPDYVGTADLPTTGTIEVTYRIKGAEDPVENTFTVEDGTANYDKEEAAQTTSSSKKLTAEVLDVSYTE